MKLFYGFWFILLVLSDAQAQIISGFGVGSQFYTNIKTGSPMKQKSDVLSGFGIQDFSERWKFISTFYLTKGNIEGEIKDNEVMNQRDFQILTGEIAMGVQMYPLGQIKGFLMQPYIGANLFFHTNFILTNSAAPADIEFPKRQDETGVGWSSSIGMLTYLGKDFGVAFHIERTSILGNPRGADHFLNVSRVVVSFFTYTQKVNLYEDEPKK